MPKAKGDKERKKVDPVRSVDRYMIKLLRDMEGQDVATRMRFAPILVKWLHVKMGVDDPDHGTGFGDEE